MTWFSRLLGSGSPPSTIIGRPEAATEIESDFDDDDMLTTPDPSFLRGGVAEVADRVREGTQALQDAHLRSRAREVATKHFSRSKVLEDSNISQPDPSQIQSRVQDSNTGSFRVRFWLHTINDEELESCQQDSYEHTIPLAEYSAHLKAFSSHVEKKPELQEALEKISNNLSHAAGRAQEIGELCLTVRPKLQHAFFMELRARGLDPQEVMASVDRNGHFGPRARRIYQQVLMSAFSPDGALANEQALIADLHEGYHREIENLQPGEQWIFPGGSLHHAVLVGFTKQKNGLIQIDVYNSGYGIQHHDQWNDKRNTCLTKANVPLREALEFLSAGLDSCLGYSLTRQQQNNDIQSIYRNFNQLPGKRILEQDPAFYRSPQKGETCTKESIDALVSNQLISQARDFGNCLSDAKVDYKDFQLYLKIKALENVSRHTLAGGESIALPRSDPDFRDRYIYPIKKYLQKCEHLDCQDERVHRPILELARLTILEVADKEFPTEADPS